VVLVEWFVISSVDPIDNVQCSVRAHEKYVITGEIFDFTVTLQHNQLRQDCNRFQINGKCPKKLHYAVVFGANQMCYGCNDGAGCNCKLPVKKSILCFVISGTNWFLETDHVNDGPGGENVKNLHTRVVE